VRSRQSILPTQAEPRSIGHRTSIDELGERGPEAACRDARSATLDAAVTLPSLTPPEIRVLGCLLEKQRTTPDAYPLSLNALRLACNQSTNRDPVVEYDEPAIRDALHRLERRGFTRLASGAGSRAPKYRHLLAEALPMDAEEQAVMCVLMLRGAQTPGELKQRSERMHSAAGLSEIQQTLRRLLERGLVASLGRRPGQKEERYVQLLGESTPENPDVHASHVDVQPVEGLHERVARLEREVAVLRAELQSRGQAGEAPRMRDPMLEPRP
jgi:uncharacterized protein